MEPNFATSTVGLKLNAVHSHEHVMSSNLTSDTGNQNVQTHDCSHLLQCCFSDNKDQLVTKLLKIAGSTEDGTDKVESLSRTAKLVIAAKDTAVKSMCPTAQNVSPSNRQALYSDSLVTKYGPKVRAVSNFRHWSYAHDK